MKTLATEFTSKSVTYRQIKRRGDLAVYSYSAPSEPKRVRGYETIIVQSHDGYEIAGVKVAPAESYPSTKSWGKKGFSYLKLDSALDKLSQVEESRLSREAS